MRWIAVVGPESMILASLVLGVAAFYSEAELPVTPSTSESRTQKPLRVRVNDCGSTSLYILCKWNEQPHSLKELQELSGESIVGTDMLSLKKTALALKFEVQSCRCSFDKLLQHVSYQKQFAILHSPKLHYVPVVCATGSLRVRIVDSTLGIQDVTDTDLSNLFAWDGTALLLTAK